MVYMEIFALVALSSMQSLSKIKISMIIFTRWQKFPHTCTCRTMVLHDILCICTCISDLKCVRARVYVCTRGAFGQGGVCLKSVCQLYAYVCLH